jgi:hypothetical protein
MSATELRNSTWEGYRAGTQQNISIRSMPSSKILPVTVSVDRVTATSHWYVLEKHTT